MTIEELAHREIELYNTANNLLGTIDDKLIEIRRLGLFDQYRQIHNEYARLSKSNLEALKRGLFLIWYSRLEPGFLTGIGELDFDSELKIIKVLDRRLNKNITDYELDWMIDYYSTWDYLFESFSDFKSFQDRLKKTKKLERPVNLNSESMRKRGQMEIYWSSVKKK